MYSYNVADGNEKIRYALRKQVPGDPVTSDGCGVEAEDVVREFENIRLAHNSNCPKPIAEMIHSFSEEESKKMTPELVNQLGYDVASAMFPGHQILVVTHLDRSHYHNHIIMNRHHSSTGKLSREGFRTLKPLREMNDRVCRSHGLSVPNQEKKEREARMPKNVAQMIRHGRSSYLADMMQKADYARSIATNYGEYQGLLAQFDINARIEKKNISYFYPGQKVGKRGKTMGKLYDKPGLEEAFKSNDEKFQRNPQLRQLLNARLSQVKSQPGAIGEVIDELSQASGGHVQRGYKDYSKHKIVPRRAAGWARASEEDLTERSVPIDEMRKARRINIVDYCKRSGIGLEEKGQGVYTLKGRPYVELNEREWRNKKNNTRGNLIDLVASHKNMTFVEAIAEINGNKRLLFLQDETGKVKRSYTSFYIPKGERDQTRVAVHHLSSLLKQHGANHDFAEALLKSGQAQVAKGGFIRIFGKGDETGAYEFVKGDDQKWNKAKRGQFTKPFFEQSGGSRKANIYIDPFSFLVPKRKVLFPTDRGNDGHLALMEPAIESVDRFLSGHRHVDTLRLVTSSNQPAKHELDFFNVLKSRYATMGIGLELMSIDKAMPGRGLSLER